MKNLGFFGKLIYWGNIIAALLLFVSFILPYLPPKNFPTLSLLSLVVSPLILLNLLFFAYWLLRLHRNMFLSLIMLVISYFHFHFFYEFSSQGDPSEFENTLSILTYNVRLFNAYEKNPGDEASKGISEILQTQNPDIVCIQEYYKPNTVDFSAYPYQYIHFKNESVKLGHAIFSKYPLLNKGAFDFVDSYNNTIYADVVKNNDTVRVYSLHLQSMGIIPRVSFLQEGDKEKLRKRVASAFAKQQHQVTEILKHKETSPHPVLLCGDLNNTSFSYTYHKLQSGMLDAFKESGNGLGTTFKFDRFPMRIDYIFASEEFEVLDFENISKTFSDHYPLKTTVGWDSK